METTVFVVDDDPAVRGFLGLLLGCAACARGCSRPRRRFSKATIGDGGCALIDVRGRGWMASHCDTRVAGNGISPHRDVGIRRCRNDAQCTQGRSIRFSREAVRRCRRTGRRNPERDLARCHASPRAHRTSAAQRPPAAPHGPRERGDETARGRAFEPAGGRRRSGISPRTRGGSTRRVCSKRAGPPRYTTWFRIACRCGSPATGV